MDFYTDTDQGGDDSGAADSDDTSYGADDSGDYSDEADADSESYGDEETGEYDDGTSAGDGDGDVGSEGYGDGTDEGSADDEQAASDEGESGPDGSAWDMGFKTGPGRFKENAALVEALWSGGYDIVHSAVSYGVHGAERAYDHYISGDAESEERHNQEMEQDKQEHWEGFRRIAEAL